MYDNPKCQSFAALIQSHLPSTKKTQVVADLYLLLSISTRQTEKRFFQAVKTSTLQWHRVFQPGPCYTHEEEFSAAANIPGTRQGPP